MPSFGDLNPIQDWRAGWRPLTGWLLMRVTKANNESAYQSKPSQLQPGSRERAGWGPQSLARTQFQTLNGFWLRITYRRFSHFSIALPWAASYQSYTIKRYLSQYSSLQQTSAHFSKCLFLFLEKWTLTLWPGWSGSWHMGLQPQG